MRGIVRRHNTLNGQMFGTLEFGLKSLLMHCLHTQTHHTHARANWPPLAAVHVRFRGQFAHLGGQLHDGDVLPLGWLLHNGGSAGTWAFALYLASSDRHQDQVCSPAASPALQRKPSTGPAASTRKGPPCDDH